MLCFAVFALAAVSLRPVHSYVEWKSWTSSIAMSVAIGAFVVALLTHLWVGLRDVLLDYAKPPRLQRASLAVLAAALVTLAVWALRILVRAHA